ncbi:transglutaminase [Frateuria sp. Soil773]|uniref:TMEM175 family protein n=1 Tax=Frateuria sp. Soil773 TaxID=1736407 RepID=UPI0006FD38A6|nr:TMEM175 family protein [Frateuria sp. Soil773]KRF01963.1 transglutaminase [Frateuria sp. Soil773]
MSVTEQREGIEAGRLDMFVDGAFAFTLTLLAIGGETIPDSGSRLVALLRGIPAAACCFAQIAMMWHGHVRWRRLCPRSTTPGLLFSLVLVFLALVFVYPLHMVYASAFCGFSGGLLSPEFTMKSWLDIKAVYVCFGLAFACMSGTLVLLFRHAARQPGLAGATRLQARVEAVGWSLPVAIGLVSVVLTLLLPDTTGGLLTALPGMVYMLMFLTGPVVSGFRRRYAS